MTFDVIKIARVSFSLLCVQNPALYRAASRWNAGFALLSETNLD
jgi:hypothetical protein